MSISRKTYITILLTSMLFGCDNFSWATEFPFPHLDKNDTIIMTQLPYHDAGAAGDNMIWDFSTVDLSEGKDYTIALNYLSDSTFCAQEHRTRYYWHVSGDSLYCTGYENATTYLPYSSPELHNTCNSYKRIIDKEYPILPPSEKAKWQMPGVGGDVGDRGIRFHYGAGIAYKNSKGCFVLFYNYTLLGDDISITLRDSQKAAWDFAHNLGGIGLVNYDADIRGEIKPRIGVSCFPFGISDKLVLKTAR